MDFCWEYLTICYGVVAGLLYNFVYWIEVVLGLPTGENETDSIDQSHTNLKHLVERIIEEVFKIPEFFDHSGVPNEPQRINLPQFDPKKYEELLATAVLNKLVESYSYERRFENSSGIHSGSDFESNVHTATGKTQLETISTSSSIEPRSDSSNSIRLNDQPMSLTEINYTDNLSPEHSNSSDEEAYLSDYIQKHKVPLPGIEALDSDSFDEDYQSINSNDTEGNWQENWLFRKRKLKNETAAAIGMLVPSPMEDVKALIGDKTTDEVSDLSEAGSDLENDENEPLNGRRSADLPHALIESKTIIGGKNEIGSFNEVKTIDELLQPDSLVSTQSIDNQTPVIMEAKNDLILMSDCDRKPVVLHVKEKTIQIDNGELTNDIRANKNVCIQNGSRQITISQSTEVIVKDVPQTKGSVFDTEGGEPPIPTPRKKSKSLESAKPVAAVEVSTQPIIHESNSLPDNITIVSQIIDAFDINMEIDKIQKTLDDELDSSINDIYESIDDDQTIDYQSLIAEDEKVANEIKVKPSSQQLILEANNPFVEDCLNETTQEILQEQLTKNQIDLLTFNATTSEQTSNILSENYICKVVPTEFDLSVDSSIQSKSDILDVIVRKGVEDKSVPQEVCISSKPAVEIASNETLTLQDPQEQSSAIPTLIISKSYGDTPPPVVASVDYLSLKPKKVLKGQDSLELPKDDRDKFEPAKRVESFELDDIDRNIDANLSASENNVNSEEFLNVTVEQEKNSEDDFIIVTEDEMKALKFEEQESLCKTQDQKNLIDSLSTTDETLANTNAKNDQTNDIHTSVLHVKRLSSSQPIETDEIVDAQNSQNYKSVLELSPLLESNNSTVISPRKTFELPIKISSSILPAIQEPTTLADTNTKPSSTNTTSELFTSNQIIDLDPATNITQLNDQGPLPGSIAEREHLKWMNAQDIPNNPYSAEALQRRLSQKSPTKVIDIHLALAAKPIDDLKNKPEVDNGKPLQIVLGAGEPDHLRYGRDYYINDSKTASGTRKKTPSMQRYSSTDEDNILSKPTTPDSDVFTAKIVQIRDDPGHTSDDSTKLKLSISDRVSDNSLVSLQSDRSDDSETRVYDLRKNETAYLRSDIIRTSRHPVGTTVTPPPTPIDGESSHKNLDQFFAIKQLNQLKRSEDEPDTTSQTKSSPFHTGRGLSKPLSPETLKFFAPKPKPVFTSKVKMEDIAPIKPLILEREEKVIQQNGTIEKAVIEEDVISALPSVKALAKNFTEPSNETTKPPIQRPKSFTWQVSNENGNSNGFSREPSSDSYIPLYESRYHPVAPGHSITARSLSTKFREELKHSISDDASNSTADNIEIVEREHSPDRPSSPVLLKGIFKEKMSFFQNLETK